MANQNNGTQIAYINTLGKKIAAAIAAGDTIQRDQLFELIYNYYVQKFRAAAYNHHQEEDIVQENCISLLNACRTYDPAGKATFNTYVQTCVKRHAMEWLMSQACKHRRPVSGLVSLDAQMNAEQGKETFGDMMEDTVDTVRRSEAELIMCLKHDIFPKISEIDRKIIVAVINGYNRSETAKLVGISRPTLNRHYRELRSVEGLEEILRNAL